MGVQRQFDERPYLLDENPTERPDYDACIAISTNASLREMIPPGAMVILAPLLSGIFFGVNAVSGLLVGSLISSIQLAVSMSNSGGAWDNAKKYIEKASPDSELQGKGSDIHKASVVGDTVGDPFKDTSGPALNIIIKLMSIIALTIAPLISGNANWENYYYGFVPGALIIAMTFIAWYNYEDIEYKESYASPAKAAANTAVAEIESGDNKA